MINLSELQIYLLLQSLKAGGELSRSKVCLLRRKDSLIHKDLAIDGLIKLDFIKKEIKKDTSENNKTKKNPIFYLLTENGLNWLKGYALSEDK